MKATGNPRAAAEGRSQVSRSVRLAHARWPHLRALVLWVDLRGDEAEEDPRGVAHVDDVDVWLASSVAPPILRLPSAPLWAAAGGGPDARWATVRAETRAAVRRAAGLAAPPPGPSETSRP